MPKVKRRGRKREGGWSRVKAVWESTEAPVRRALHFLGRDSRDAAAGFGRFFFKSLTPVMRRSMIRVIYRYIIGISANREDVC